MFLTRWLEKVGLAKSRRPAARNPYAEKPVFRPGLEALGERVVPHAGFLFRGPPPFAAPWAELRSVVPAGDDDSLAAELAVLVRGEAFAGNETRVTVVALDSSGRVERDYAGTVALTSSDVAAGLPANYTFTDEDNGRHTFTVTLNTTGRQTVTATDVADPFVTGDARVSVDVAPEATELFVRAERDVISGAVTRVLVAALDESNRVVRGYDGTVTLTSSGAAATLPGPYTFTSSDHGVHVFEVTPTATGRLTLTATDGDGVTGSVTVTVDEAPVATHFAVVARPRSVSGESLRFFVVALDETNRPVRNYTGTVAVTSSDTGATLPENYTFTADDHGVKALSATLNATGSQTITVTDTANPALTGSVTIAVGSEDSDRGFGRGGLFGGQRGRGGR